MIRLDEDYQDSAAWDRFVSAHEQSRFCHLHGYGQAVTCYGYTPRHFAFLKDDILVGVLPSAEAHSLLYGRKLISQPFSEFGGLLLDPALSADDIHEIAALLRDYLGRHKAIKSIELHGNHGVPEGERDAVAAEAIPHHIGYLALDRPTEAIWKAMKYSARKQVNQGSRNGIEVFSRCDEETIRTDFFPLYLHSMKRLGVPPHKLQYFLDCQRALGDKMFIFWARKDETLLAGLLGFSSGSRVNIVNTVSDPQYWSLRPNDLLHWEMIKWTAESGHKFFDFGSIRYQGQMDFKAKWGCEMADHKYYFILPKTADTAKLTVNSSSTGMTRMADAWAKYVPLSLGRRIGPTIRQQLAR